MLFFKRRQSAVGKKELIAADEDHELRVERVSMDVWNDVDVGDVEDVTFFRSWIVGSLVQGSVAWANARVARASPKPRLQVYASFSSKLTFPLG
jgi:hypothetical protein